MSDHAAWQAGGGLPVNAHPPHPLAADPRRRWALVLLCLAQFMVILDITVVKVALPRIGADLHLDRAWLTWVVTAYTLCFGGLMLLGGRLAHILGQRRMFFINLPVGIGAVPTVPVVVAASRPARPTRRIDLPGALTGTLATGAVIYGLVTAGSDGWGAGTTLRWLAIGLVLVGVLVAVERATRVPLVSLGLLGRRPLVAGQLVMLATSGLLLATDFLASLFLQRRLGYTALDTGLVFLPAALATIAGSHLAVRTIGHLGPRPVAAAGFGLTTAGASLPSRLPADAAVLVDLLPGLLLATARLGGGFVVATTTAMAHVDPAQAGVTSGLLNTGHELGASLRGTVVSTIAAASLTGINHLLTPMGRGTRLTNTVDIRPASRAPRLLAPLAASRVKTAVAATSIPSSNTGSRRVGMTHEATRKT